MSLKSRSSSRLVAGRESNAGARYFLTWCTHHRAPILTNPATLEAARTAIRAIALSRDGRVLAATIMPDHIHLLLELGTRLTVSQVVAKTKSAIVRGQALVKWQLNFFEHRVRDDRATEDFAFYIFMNPYCAHLCRLDEIWPGWIVSRDTYWAFEEKLHQGQFPAAKWLPEAERFAHSLPAGAD